MATQNLGGGSPSRKGAEVAIVDYGMGNLLSIGNACKAVGLDPIVTSEGEDLFSASAVILPGVGAFGDAMQVLEELDLVGPLRDLALAGKPILGICLGMQLLMEESSEFGCHEGLGILAGECLRLGSSNDTCRKNVKVPHVGWNNIHSPSSQTAASWDGSILAGIPDGAFMYFVHSYYVLPRDPEVVLATSRYGSVEFCSAIRYKNVQACQFHPERSGRSGLQLFDQLLSAVP